MGKLKLLIFCLTLIIIAVMPDAILETLHLLLELVMEGAHVLFEVVEVFLDKVIEHTFHTELHQTQIIVFYIIATGVFFILRKFWCVLRRLVPNYINDIKNTVSSTKAFYKVQIEDYWQNLLFFQKFKIYSIGVLVMVSVVFLFM